MRGSQAQGSAFGQGRARAADSPSAWLPVIVALAIALAAAIGVVLLNRYAADHAALADRATRFAELGTIAGFCGAAVAVGALFVRSDRSRRAAALLEGERRGLEQYRTLVERIPAVVYVDARETHGATMYISPRLEALLGYRPAEYQADPGLWEGRLHPDDRERVLNEAARTTATGEPFQAEYRLLARDGREVWVRDEAVRVDSAPGEPALWQGFLADVTARKTAEAALRAGEERFRAIVETTAEWIWEMDREGRHTYSNPAIESILGYRPEELVGIDSLVMMDEADRAVVAAELPRWLEEGRGWTDLELRWRHRDGSERWLESTAVPILDGQGKVAGFRGADRDVTERRQAEAALRASEERFRTLVERLPAVVYLSRPGCAPDDHEIVYVSPRVRDLFGYEAAEWMADPGLWYRLIHPDDLATVEAEDRRTEETGESFSVEYRLVARDGTLCWVHNDATLIHDEDGRPLYWQGVMLDVTAQKEAEAELSRERDLLRLLMDSLPDIVFFKDEESRFVRINRTLAGIWGIADPADAVGKTDFDYVPDEIAGAFVEDDRRVMEGGVPLVNRLEPIAADGEIRWLLTSKVPIVDADGRSIGLVGLARDVTEWRQAEEALRASEEQLRLALAAGGVATWEWDVTAGTLRTEGLDQLLELPPGLLDGTYGGFLELVHPDDRARWLEADAETATVAGDYALEYRVVRPDGSVRWLDDRGKVDARDVEGRAVRVLGALVDVTAAKAAEAELARERDLLQTLMDSLPDQIFFKDTDLRYLRMNRASAASWGLDDPAEAIGKTDFDFPPADHAEAFVADDRAVLASGVPLVNRLEPYTAPDGEVRWLLTSKVPIVDEDGHAAGLVGVARDITDFHQAEEALRASEERLRLALDAAQLGTWDWDVANDTLEWSDATARHAGILASDRSFSYGDFLSALHPDDRDRVDAHVHETLAAGDDYLAEYRNVLPDGTILWNQALGRVERDETGRAIRLRGVAQDITARKRAEEAVREGEERFRSAFADAAIGMALVAPDGRWLRVNRALCELLGYDEADLLTRTFQDITHPDDLAADLGLGRRLLAGELATYQLDKRYLRKDGRVVWGRLSVSLVHDAAGEPAYVVSQVVDLTEAKEAERAKDEFVATVSHELRTPLTSISGYVDLMCEGEAGELSEDQLEFLEIVRANARRLTRLVNDLLEVATLGAHRLKLKPRSVDLDAVIRSVAAAIAPEISRVAQSLTVELPESLPCVWADPDRVGQVLTNLVSNATKYTPGGGEIAIRATADCHTVRVEVSDTGPGLTPEDQGRIFERFVRADNETTRGVGGVGLGLPIARALVEAQGGTLGVVSEPGRGTTFAFSLPRADQVDGSAPDVTEVPAAQNGHRTTGLE